MQGTNVPVCRFCVTGIDLRDVWTVKNWLKRSILTNYINALLLFFIKKDTITGKAQNQF
jgi:hypothetical protein